MEKSTESTDEHIPNCFRTLARGVVRLQGRSRKWSKRQAICIARRADDDAITGKAYSRCNMKICNLHHVDMYFSTLFSDTCELP